MPNNKQNLEEVSVTIVKAVGTENVILFCSLATSQLVEHRYKVCEIPFDNIGDFNILAITKPGETRKDYKVQAQIENYRV
ncbi:MAG: hypothetical protein Q8932_18335 [Bacteroidota bacterium]|nr:hypothetical protein [Bacteroidota bacterium]